MKGKGMNKPSTDDGAARPKKPYQSPELKVYGDLTAITSNVGGTGKQDGSGTGKTKTGLP
jgi:hypothetical protein